MSSETLAGVWKRLDRPHREEAILTTERHVECRASSRLGCHGYRMGDTTGRALDAKRSAPFAISMDVFGLRGPTGHGVDACAALAHIPDAALAVIAPNSNWEPLCVPPAGRRQRHPSPHASPCSRLRGFPAGGNRSNPPRTPVPGQRLTPAGNDWRRTEPMSGVEAKTGETEVGAWAARCGCMRRSGEENADTNPGDGWRRSP